MDRVLTLDILGQPFTFKADVDVSDAKAVADYVIESVDRARSQCAQQKATSIDKSAILILTALNITNEFFELKREHQRLLHDLNQRSEDLLQSLESNCN